MASFMEAVISYNQQMLISKTFNTKIITSPLMKDPKIYLSNRIMIDL